MGVSRKLPVAGTNVGEDLPTSLESSYSRGHVALVHGQTGHQLEAPGPRAGNSSKGYLCWISSVKNCVKRFRRHPSIGLNGLLLLLALQE